MIIRAHSTGAIPGDPIAIFTSEPYDHASAQNKYVYDLVAGRIELVALTKESVPYYGITSGFVRDGMRGRFPHSIVIMMGCTGLRDSEMAQAFVDRGAASYISWDKSVAADRTDRATLTLLHSLAQGKTIIEAINTAMDEVGPDPTYNSNLGYYPGDQGGIVLGLHYDNALMLNVQITPETLVPLETKLSNRG